MKYIRTALWITAFLIACLVQLKCVQHVDSTMEKRDNAEAVESFPNHSELEWDTLHDAQMEADQKAIMERQREQF